MTALHRCAAIAIVALATLTACSSRHNRDGLDGFGLARGVQEVMGR